MAEGVPSNQTQCEMAIEYVSQRISNKFPQYPTIATIFKTRCVEEAFEEIDVLIDDVAEGFDESVLLEAIAEDIDMNQDDKELICKTIHHLLSTYTPSKPEPPSLNLGEDESILLFFLYTLNRNLFVNKQNKQNK